MSFTPNVFPTMLNQPLKGLAQILNATGTSQVIVVTGGNNGSKVLNLIGASTDTTTQTIAISLVRSATTYLLATTSVAANSGSASGTGPVDLLMIVPNLPRDQDGQPYLFLNSGDTLVVNSASAVSSGKSISVHSDYANF